MEGSLPRKAIHALSWVLPASSRRKFFPVPTVKPAIMPQMNLWQQAVQDVLKN
jgi:hypothetical protein